MSLAEGGDENPGIPHCVIGSAKCGDGFCYIVEVPEKTTKEQAMALAEAYRGKLGAEYKKILVYVKEDVRVIDSNCIDIPLA